ncbi:MAG: hypothetical protein AAF564_25085 [Bacteroidota bacterium]
MPNETSTKKIEEAIKMGRRSAYPIYFSCVLLLVSLASACEAQPTDVPQVMPLAGAAVQQAEDFGALVEKLSGEGGYFDTDNLISNESSYLHVIPRLNQLGLRGGAYLGVGPDQNFSYIAHLEPELAIIVDIRRDNMLTHLFFKALFELADNRPAFLRYLFARAVDITEEAAHEMDVAQLMRIVSEAGMADATVQEAIHKAVMQQVRQSGVALNEADLDKIGQIHAEFMAKGPALRFTSHGRAPQSYYPTYEQLATETTLSGETAGFLGQEVYFQRLKKMQEENRIVPVVGDFAEAHALPAIGAHLKENGLEVHAFYTSNVEFYLMRGQKINRFAANVRQLPLSPQSIFIRSYFNRWRAGHPLSVPGYGSTQLMQPIEAMLSMETLTYRDLILQDILDY